MLPQSIAQGRQKRPILLVKEQVLVAHESHFAGGIHLFSCLATSLAASGLFEVHLFTTARKSLVMHHALSHGLLGSLKAVQVAAALPTHSELRGWTSKEGVHFTVVLQPDSSTADSTSPEGALEPRQADLMSRGSSSSSKADVVAAVLAEAVASAEAQMGQQCIVLLDADRLQHVTVPGGVQGCTACSCEQQQQQGQAVPFVYALAQRLKHQHEQQPGTHRAPPQQQQLGETTGSKLLVLVQNLHHLPFGPCGCGPRTPAALAAWQQVDGLLCVSQFVASYMQQHALHLLPLGSSSSSSSGDSACDRSSTSIVVVHPAALGAFGRGPFADLGAAAAARIWGQQEVTSTPVATQQQQQPQLIDGEDAGSVQRHQQYVPGNQHAIQQQQQQWQQAPVIGMLKLSREKGSDLFFALAAQLPHFQFLAVAADDATQQAAAAAGLKNVRLLQPQADVEGVLRHMDVVLVPSVLQEAFGMVVLDAMLRGIPVLVADAGALPEAAANAAAAVLPLDFVQFPAAGLQVAPESSNCMQQQQQQTQVQQILAGGNPSTRVSEELELTWQAGQRSWLARVYPPLQQQHLDAWAEAVQQVFSSRKVYKQHSNKARAAAEQVLGDALERLQQMMDWLLQRLQ